MPKVSLDTPFHFDPNKGIQDRTSQGLTWVLQEDHWPYLSTHHSRTVGEQLIGSIVQKL